MTHAYGVTFDNKSGVCRHEERRFDWATLNEIDNTNAEFIALNQRLWDFVERLDQFGAETLTTQPEGPDA